MTRRVLITGSEGLVGSALGRALEGRGFEVSHLDLRARRLDGRGDVRNEDRVRRALRDCHGVVHLAAVSRVVWGEQDPDLCWSTNVEGTRTVLDASLASPLRPWVIFVSSREVYGEAQDLPVTEDAPARPLNIYGESKVAGERLASDARRAGLRTAILRLSNVYGDVADYPDRVVPAFARAAATGAPLRLDGPRSTFDFTHLDDVVRGFVGTVALLEGGGPPPPPVHLVTGTPTTLAELASLAVEIAGTSARIVEAAPRTFDVSRFYGSPERARTMLGWAPQVSLREGLARLINGFRAQQVASATRASAS